MTQVQFSKDSAWILVHFQKSLKNSDSSLFSKIRLELSSYSEEIRFDLSRDENHLMFKEFFKTLCSPNKTKQTPKKYLTFD